jgi:hypothetical protein
MLDRQPEERAQAFGDLIAGHALAEPLERDLEAPAEVDEGVAGDDRSAVFDPEHEVVLLVSRERLDSDGQPIAGRDPVPLDCVVRSQPGQVGLPPDASSAVSPYVSMRSF